jgi:hypothetical protein
MGINKPRGIFIKVLFIVTFSVSIGIIFAGPLHNIITDALAGESEGSEDEADFDNIIINNDDYEKDRKGPVPFAHKKHAKEYGLLCWDCHHQYDDEGKNEYSPWGVTEKCSDCHDASVKEGNIVKLQTAYHLTCKTCHEEMKIFGDEPFVYRKCTKCHESNE